MLAEPTFKLEYKNKEHKEHSIAKKELFSVVDAVIQTIYHGHSGCLRGSRSNVLLKISSPDIFKVDN